MISLVETLFEGNLSSLKRTEYFPKYGLPYVLSTIGSSLGGGYLGYKAAESAGLKDPELGIAPGLVSGFYLGNLASEYADRKTREKEKTPYVGPRTFDDSVKETGIGLGLGVPTAIVIDAATGLPGVSAVGGGLAGRIGTHSYNRIKYPESFEKKK